MAYLVNVSILVDASCSNEVYDGLNALMHKANEGGNSPIIDYQISDADSVHAALEDSISNDTYEEGDAFKEWVIYSQSEADASEGEAGYWSNDLGWCSLENATIFDVRAIHLPITTNKDATIMLHPKQFKKDV